MSAQIEIDQQKQKLAEPTTREDYSGVVKVIHQYLDGLHHCDVEIFKQVFHPQAIYATADETPLLYRQMDEYFAIIAKRQSPASRGELRSEAIDDLQFAGENTAVARVRCAIADTQFVDFLTLIRTEGRWQIMSKIFQIKQGN